MKKKKWMFIASITVLVILAITGFSVYRYHSSPAPIKNKNHLDQKQFSLHFTTNLSYNPSQGEVLTYRGNKIRSSKSTAGIDNGTLFYDKGKLYFSDKNGMYNYNSKTKQYHKEKRAVETLDIETLQLQGQVVHIYNSGVKDGGKYRTTLYDESQSLIVSDLILNVGSDQKNLYLFSDRNKNNEFKVYIVSYYKNKLHVKKTLQFSGVRNGESTIIGRILSKQNRLYFIEDDGKKACYFVQFSLDTYQVKRKKIFTYKNSDEVSNQTPYTGSNSSFIYQNHFYFLDKLGQIFIMNMNDEKKPVMKQRIFQAPASRFVDVDAQSIYILSELKTFDKLESFSVDKRGYLKLEATKIIRLPQKASDMYLSNFKVMK